MILRILFWSSVPISSEAFFLPQYPSRIFSQSRHVLHSRPRPFLSLFLSSPSSFSGSNKEEVIEAIQSLLDFHQGEWRGQANSFSVSPDVAAGIVQRKVSSEYNVAVKLGIDADQCYSLTETISLDDTIALRALPLNGCNMDVDSVDGSYSLDSTSAPDIPTELSGTDKQCQFIIEHCIAAGEHRRARCFAMYGVDKSLIRIVVCNEEKVDENVRSDRTETDTSSDNGGGSSSMFTAQDLVEMSDDVDRLVDKITANMNQPMIPSLPSVEVNQWSSVDPSTNNESSSNMASRLDKLGARMSTSSIDGAQKLSPHDMSLLELSSGVWLGDVIVRDTPTVAASPLERGRGFGSSISSTSSNVSVNTQSRGVFAGWTRGVQKVALRWMWNFGDEIRKVVDVGKALGSPLDASLSKSVAGTVCVDESLSRRIPKDKRMVYIDLAQDMVAFLLGPCAVQVPRYITFHPSSSRAVKPFYTEFSLYQSARNNDLTVERGASKSVMDPSGNVQNLPEVVCSTICRLYDFDGKLKQGSTSFYTLQRFGLEDSDEA
jgi:hypothetical protein